LVPFVFADDIEDTSIIDELNKDKPQISTSLFKLQTFESCSDMQSVMKEYIKLYWENSMQRNYYFTDGINGIKGNMVLEEATAPTANMVSRDDADTGAGGS
jgi:hypothetical protein